MLVINGYLVVVLFFFSQRNLIARGIVQYEADGPEASLEEDGNDEGYDTVDTLRPKADAAPSVSGTHDVESLGAPSLLDSHSDDMLQCPRCKTEFPSDRHNELLEHIEVCCE